MRDFREDLVHVQCMFRDPLGRKPIAVNQLINFLKVEVSERQVSDTGWTDRFGENNLQIHGGIIGGVDYVSNIRYGRKIANKYNDFVTPLHIKEILTDEGWDFFCDYYKQEVESICKKYHSEADFLIEKAENLRKSAESATFFLSK